MISADPQDQVVTLPALGEVFFRVIDGPVGAQRAHQLQVSAAAHGGDFRLEIFGDLHRKAAHPAGSAVDQHFFPGLNFPFVAQPIQSGGGRYRYRRGFLET